MTGPQDSSANREAAQPHWANAGLKSLSACFCRVMLCCLIGMPPVVAAAAEADTPGDFVTASIQQTTTAEAKGNAEKANRGSAETGDTSGAGSAETGDSGSSQLPDELERKISRYRQEKEALRQEMQAIVDELEDKSSSSVGEAMQAFQKANADRLNAFKTLGREIREELEQYEERDVPAHVRDLQDSFQQHRQLLTERRKELYKALRNAQTEEERNRIAAEFYRIQEEIRQELQDQRAEHAAGGGR